MARFVDCNDKITNMPGSKAGNVSALYVFLLIIDNITMILK